MGFLVVSLYVVLSLVLGARGQQCTESQLNQNIRDLVSDAITIGDSGSPPAIELLDSQTVCLAAGSTRDLYRYASVVVSFNCSGSLPPGGPLGVTTCDGELTVQFDFECVDGPQWQRALTLGGDNVFNPAVANLSTPLRTDCSFCLDPALGGGAVVEFAVDVVTHCGECDADCLGPLELCTGSLPSQCCNLYQDNECTIECDAAQAFEPDGINCTKMCPLLPPPINGQVFVSLRTVNSEATYSCQEGFILTPDEDTRTCTQLTADAPEWVPSTAPMCQVITCEELVAPSNGTLTQTDGNNFGSVANYTCDDGFELEGNSTRTCQLSGNWTGSDPTCEAEVLGTEEPVEDEEDSDPFDDDDVDDIDITFIVLGIIFFLLVAAILVLLVLYGIYVRGQE